jgi:hypothetical protein
MDTKKKYSTYAEIDRELEILRLQRTIYYKKIFLSIEKTKDSVNPLRVTSKFLENFKSTFKANYGTLLKLLLPFVINWLLKRKRGN